MLTAIVQARLNSSRLSRKVLLPFAETTVLAETIRQIKKSKVDRVVLTTPDRELLPYCFYSIIWKGDESDLISRYYKAAIEYHADPIVRITSDCPLILPEVINLVIREHFLYGCEYTYNHCDDEPNGWPDGLDVEVFDFSLLQKAYILAEEREHMTALRDNSTVHIVKPDRDYGPCTSINTKEDYDKALQILRGRHNGSTPIR